MSSGLHHIAVFVRDMDRALHLFRDLLGFDLRWRASPVDISALSPALGVPVVEVELAYVQGRSGGAAIELMRPITPPIDPAVAPYGARGSGHLSVTVEDLDRVCQRLREEGWPPLTPIVPVTTAGGDTARLCFFRTEDGLTIELIDAATFSEKSD